MLLVDPRVGELVLRIRELGIDDGHGRGDLLAADGEVLRGLHGVKARPAEQSGEPLIAGLAGISGLADLLDLPLDLRETVPAVPGEFDGQAGLARPQVGQPTVKLFALSRQPGPF